MATILTAHGTFASGPEIGEKWWQKGSLFEKHLTELVEAEDGELTFQPVIWDGLNSEASRRAAGLALFQEMKALETHGKPFTVIGHSHGGSVIAASLMESAKGKNRLGYMKSWLTIGTPFIATQRERFLFQRLSVFGKAAYIALIVIFLVFLLVVLQTNSDMFKYDYGFWQAALDFLPLAIIGAIPFLLFYIILRYLESRKLHLYNNKVVKFANTNYRPRWISLWHQNDEAIQGLGSLNGLNFDIFSKSCAVGPLSMLSILFLPLAYFIAINSPSAMVELSEHAQTWFGSFDSSFEMTALDGKLIGAGENMLVNNKLILVIFLDSMPRALLDVFGVSKNDEMIIATGILMVSAIAMLIAYGFTVAFNRLSYWVSCEISRRINPITMGQIRAKAFGSDTEKDFALDAQDWPMWLNKGFPPLPESIGSELQAVSDAAVGAAVPKFRNAVTSFTAAAGNQEKSDMMSEYLTWDELIHTSYFRNSHFRKLVAFALTKTDGFRATDAFKQDPEYDLVAGWHREITDSLPSPEVA